MYHCQLSRHVHWSSLSLSSFAGALYIHSSLKSQCKSPPNTVASRSRRDRLYSSLVSLLSSPLLFLLSISRVPHKKASSLTLASPRLVSHSHSHPHPHFRFFRVVTLLSLSPVQFSSPLFSSLPLPFNMKHAADRARARVDGRRSCNPNLNRYLITRNVTRVQAPLVIVLYS
jgi:hypothetical protein